MIFLMSNKVVRIFGSIDSQNFVVISDILGESYLVTLGLVLRIVIFLQYKYDQLEIEKGLFFLNSL